MNWKKSLSIVGTLLMLIGQNITGMTAFAGTIADTETVIESEGLYFEQEDKTINELTINKDETKQLTFVDTNKKDTEAVINLPESLMVDIEETNNKVENEGSFVSYNRETRKVSIQMNNENKRKVQLIVKGNQVTKNTPQQFYAQVRRADNKNYRSKPVKVVINANRTDSVDSQAVTVNDMSEEETSESDSTPQIPGEKNTLPKSPSVRAGNRNVDLDISPMSGTVLSGQDATYLLSFKVTGNQTRYTDGKITVDIPKEYDLNQDLSELEIAGVVPTRIADTGQLIYNFASIEAGQTYTTTIKLKTNNGVTPDGTVVTLVSNFSAAEFSGQAESKAAVTINSNLTINVSKNYAMTTDKNGRTKTDPPVANDTGIWNIKISAQNKDKGLLYFKEGSKITVIDTLPKSVTYVGDDHDGSYDMDKRTITWSFDAPSNEEQAITTASLFNKEIKVKTKFNEDIKSVQEFKNSVTVSGINYTGGKVTSNADATVYAGGNGDSNPVPSGALLVPDHRGPSNGKGDTAVDLSKLNPDPSIYDTADVSFKNFIAPYTANSGTKDFTKYEINYFVDPNLNLTYIGINNAGYSPDSSYPQPKPPLIGINAPTINIYVTINGKEQLLVKEFSKNKIIIEEYGIKRGTHISKIRYEYVKKPAGFNQFMFSHFDVKKGFAGKIENKVRFDVAGFNSKGKAVSWNTEQDMNDHQKLTGPRNANVVPVPVGTVPVAKTQVALDKSNGGVIQSGSNRVTGYLQTDNSSTLPLDSNLNAMVLLPVGVTVDKTSPNYQLSNERGSWDTRTIDGTNANGNIKIISNNYKNTKQQLVKVEWNAFSLQPGRAVGYGFNVNVSASAPSPLKIDTYGFSGNKQFKVPEKATALNDSYLETDSDDLNGDGNTNQNRVRSSNQYRIVKENRIITIKLVKGDQDKGFSKFGHTSPGGTIDYQLTMKNNGSAIGTFALIDVLPSVGDLGITDNVRRDSKFAPIMTGPISLPGEWNGKVTVYYSEATNPKRDSLDKLVTYPSTTQHLENPLGAQEPLWKTADQVKNWGNIHSFMIGLIKVNGPQALLSL
ncbi:TPA: hypothetical protein ACIZC1_002794 [Enterococcus faecalis]